jgi:ABC-type sulfate transport system permease component
MTTLHHNRLTLLACTFIALFALCFMCVAWVVVQVLSAGDWLIGRVVAPGERP